MSDVFKKDESDTTNTKNDGVKEAIGTLLGGKKDTTATDSTKAKQGDEVKDAAKSILGGLLKKKKKDTVN